MKVYLDNSATTPLTTEVKEYVISQLEHYGNPSSMYSLGCDVKREIETARNNVAKFINGDPEKVIFTSSGSAANTLAIKGLQNDDNHRKVVCYSPTAHKSMIKASISCPFSKRLEVDMFGEIRYDNLRSDLDKLSRMGFGMTPIVCVEVANSEIGTINDIVKICKITHEYGGVVIADATGYIPTNKVNMEDWDCIDYLTFSGHKLHALKGVGVLYQNSPIKLKPIVYGSQENGLFGGTENVLGVCSLGKAVESYDYSFITSEGRNYVYSYIINHIDNCFMVGACFLHRTPHNLYMYFQDVPGETLVTLMDMNGIQISTGSACASKDNTPSGTLMAIGMDSESSRNCVRFTFSGNETKDELDYVCETLSMCISQIRKR